MAGIFYEDLLQSNYKATPGGKKMTFILLDRKLCSRAPVKTDIVRKCDHFSPTFPPAFGIFTDAALEGTIEVHLPNMMN